MCRPPPRIRPACCRRSPPGRSPTSANLAIWYSTRWPASAPPSSKPSTSRDAVGVEYESRWSDIADANITHARGQGASGRAAIIRGDATALDQIVPAALHGAFALAVTSPPYGPATHGQVRPSYQHGVVKTDNRYGEDRGNLAYRNLAGLLDGFTTILSGCHTPAAPRRDHGRHRPPRAARR